jgi:hypothetical protein
VSDTPDGQPEGQPPAANRYEIVFEASGAVGKGTAESKGEQE